MVFSLCTEEYLSHNYPYVESSDFTEINGLRAVAYFKYGATGDVKGIANSLHPLRNIKTQLPNLQWQQSDYLVTYFILYMSIQNYITFEF